LTETEIVPELPKDIRLRRVHA